MVTTALNLNLTPGGVPLNLHVTQYDVGFRTYEFTPYSTPGTIDLSLASSVTLEATKPDGHAVINNCTYDSETNKITYTVQEQLCACIGKVWSKIVIRDTNENVLGTAAVIWIVEPAGVNDGAIMSDSDISALEEFVAEFGSINAYKSALDACLAATTGGTRVAATVADMTDHDYVYVYTGNETGMVNGNWYYWDVSAWTSGGVYQANYNLDTTLTVSGRAADAKAVGDAVDELKEDINRFDGLQSATWETGNISANGNDLSATTRVRTSTYIPISPNASHVLIQTAYTNGIYFALYYYDKDKTFLSANSTYWTTLTKPETGIRDIVPPEGAYLRIAARTNNDAVITDAISSALSGSFSVYSVAKFSDIDRTLEGYAPLLVEYINRSGDITNDVGLVEDYYLNATGGLTYTAGSGTTEFIRCEPNDYYEIVMKTTSGTQWIAWGRWDDVDGNFIRRDSASTPTKTDGSTKIFKVFIDIPGDGSQKAIKVSFGANYDSYSIRKIRSIDRSTLPIKSVNHRGYQTVAPENTIPAFKMSKTNGYKWIETDVQFTSDNVPVILHDRSINRTARNADGTSISSTVNIDNITYEQALTYDFGIWKGQAYAGTKIPTFDECISLCKRLGLCVRIELKSDTVTTSKLPALVEIVEKYGMTSNVEFVSFGHSLIQYIDENYPFFDIGVIQQTINSTLIDTVTALMENTAHKTSCSVSLTNTDANLKLLAATGVLIDFYVIDTTGNVLDSPMSAASYTTNRWDCGALLYLDTVG